METLKSAIAIVLLTAAGFACKSLSEPHTIKSKNGKYEVTVPGYMSESPDLMKDAPPTDASLTAASDQHGLFFILFGTRKSEAGDRTLDEQTDLSRNLVLKELTGGDSTTPEPVTVNGNEARRYRVTGTRSGTKLAYFMTIIETANDFHQILSWTDQTRASENGPILTQIADSLKINQ